MSPVQTVRSPGGATEAKQDAILTALGNSLTELQQKLEPGGEVALNAATLAALETINAVITGPVALDAPTLAALENITATISGSVAVTGPLTNAQMRATDVNTADTGEREYPTKPLYVTAAGDTTVLTPAPGKAIWVRKTQAVNRPTSPDAPLIGFRFGTRAEFWSNFVIMTRQLFKGAVNEPLIVNLDTVGQVAITVAYEEV